MNRVSSAVADAILGFLGQVPSSRERASRAPAVRAVRTGERMLVRKTSMGVLRAIAGKIGSRLARRVLGEGASRWIPVLGAVGVGGYGYFDTAQVAPTAIALFSKTVLVAPAEGKVVTG